MLVSMSAFLFVHFTFTLLTTLPQTPISVRFEPATTRYMYPYFSQNWSFFAPDPPVQDDFVVAQYASAGPVGQIEYSRWINLSYTFDKAVQKNRLSAFEILQLTLSNAYGDVGRSNLFENGKRVAKFSEIASDPDKKPPALHTLERLAMAYYSHIGEPGRLTSVRVAFLHHMFPRFTHRSQQDDLSKNNTIMIFPWTKAEDVAQL